MAFQRVSSMLNRDEVAAICGVSSKTIFDWRNKGWVPDHLQPVKVTYKWHGDERERDGWTREQAEELASLSATFPNPGLQSTREEVLKMRASLSFLKRSRPRAIARNGIHSYDLCAPVADWIAMHQPRLWLGRRAKRLALAEDHLRAHYKHRGWTYPVRRRVTSSDYATRARIEELQAKISRLRQRKDAPLIEIHDTIDLAIRLIQNHLIDDDIGLLPVLLESKSVVIKPRPEED
jgi:hypothetical protein